VLSRSIASARAQLGLRGPAVAWFSLPVAAPLLGRLGECGSIFYYQDRYDEFNHVDRVYLRRCIEMLARGADVSVATSAALASDLEAFGASPLVVSHGVDLDRFASDSRPPPDDVAGLERPLVGYVGLIDDYLALDHLVAVADRLERGTVVLIGSANTDVAALDHPRIRLLGQRPYDTMPAYLGAFDCCLIPFKPGRLSAGVDPIKLREYLAAGRPVVATAMPELARYGDVVTIAHGSEEFAGAVADTVRHETEDQALVARRRARVADESWDAVAQRLDQAIRPLLDR
jgi:glycosyltransferase involved in cell wall biosynthesis